MASGSRLERTDQSVLPILNCRTFGNKANLPSLELSINEATNSANYLILQYLVSEDSLPRPVSVRTRSESYPRRHMATCWTALSPASDRTGGNSIVKVVPCPS